MQVLLNHIVDQELTAATITSELGEAGGSIVLQSLLGSDLFVSTDGTAIFVQSPGLEAPGAEVIDPDQITCAGPVHVIDTVLLPAMPDGTVVELGEATVEPSMVLPVEAPSAAVGPALTPDVTAVEPEMVVPTSETPSAAPSTTERAFFLPDYEFSDDEAAIEPLADEPAEGPSMALLGDEPAEVDGTVEGIEVGVEPADGPAIEPMGIEPTESLAEGPSMAPEEGSEGVEEAGDATEAATADGAPSVQTETDSAFSSAALASTAAAVAAAVLVLVA